MGGGEADCLPRGRDSVKSEVPGGTYGKAH